MCVWSHSECRSFHLHSARSTKTVGGLFVPVSMKPQNVPGNKWQCPVGMPCLSDRRPSIGGHSSFSSVYQILSGDKTHVSMLFYSVGYYFTYTILPHTTTVYLTVVLIKYLHLSSLKARMVSYDTFDLLQRRTGSVGQKVESQAREGSRMSCCLKPKVAPESLVRETKDRHHSRQERRKTHFL